MLRVGPQARGKLRSTLGLVQDFYPEMIHQVPSLSRRVALE